MARWQNESSPNDELPFGQVEVVELDRTADGIVEVLTLFVDDLLEAVVVGIVAQEERAAQVLAIGADVALGVPLDVGERELHVRLGLVQEEVLGVEEEYGVEEHEGRVGAQLPRLPEYLLLDAAEYDAVGVDAYLIAERDLVEALLELVEHGVEEDVLDAALLLQVVLYAQRQVVDALGRVLLAARLAYLLHELGEEQVELVVAQLEQVVRHALFAAAAANHTRVAVGRQRALELLDLGVEPRVEHFETEYPLERALLLLMRQHANLLLLLL